MLLYSRLVLSFMLVGVLVAIAPAADASCVMPMPMKQDVRQSRYVFVGTVTSTAAGGRFAVVQVDDVWKGSGIEKQVEVRGGPGKAGVITSVDRSFRAGKRYLFFPDRGKGDHFTDNACTNTRPYRPSLDRFRPEDARGTPGQAFDGVQATQGPEGGGSLVWIGAAAGGGLLLVMLVLWRRRYA